MGDMSVHFSSKSNEASTPQDLYDSLDEEFGFTLDPCATESNAVCDRFYTKEDDGLSKSWVGEVVFMNPPYGREIGHWLRKAYYEIDATIVCLIPARTDTIYWHEYCMNANEIRFIRGRLHFSDAVNAAPFPSAIIIFDEGRPDTFDVLTCDTTGVIYI